MRKFLPTLVGILFVGCAESRSPVHVQRWDSAGTEVLAYASLAESASLEVAAEPGVWVRGDERIPPFDRISAMAVLADGSIVVADQGADQVYAFSEEGSYLWSAGRSGEGPGEFRRIEQLFVTPGDTILAVDPGLTRTTVLSPTGVYVRDEPFLAGAGAPVALLASGELLYLSQKQTDEPSVGVHHTLATWSAVDMSGASARALATTAGHDSYYGRASGRSVVFNPPFLRHAYVAPLDSGFAFSLSDEGRIDSYGPEGDLLRSVRFPGEALSAEITDPQAVRDALLDGVPPPMQDGFRELVQDLPIPARWPPIGGMLTDDAHRLWVQEYRPAVDAETTWHVFAADGLYVSEVKTPGGFTPMVIRHDQIAGTWRDELDVESVRLYRIRER